MVSLWTRLALQGVWRRSFHTSKCTSLFHEFPDKEGYRKKSDEEKDWESWTLRKRIALELKLMGQMVKEYFSETFEGAVNGPKRLVTYDHEREIVWKFKGKPEELKEWVVTTDADHNQGFSTGQLDLTKDSKGLFHGFIDTRLPSDGRIKNTGYVNLKLIPRLNAFKNPREYDWTPFTHLVFRVRGDGRVYALNLHLKRKTDVCMYDTYHYFIWTRGGPYWQYVRIPFSKFLFAYKGRIQASMVSIPASDVCSISFTIADKIPGPYRFEIDYIAVEYDPSHIEDSAYEQYEFDQKFW